MPVFIFYKILINHWINYCSKIHIITREPKEHVKINFNKTLKLLLFREKNKLKMKLHHHGFGVIHKGGGLIVHESKL